MPDRNIIEIKVKIKNAFIYLVAKRISHLQTLNTGNL